MSKGLDALKDIRYKLSALEFVLVHERQERAPYIQETKWSIIARELTALEIIKDHGVDAAEIMICQDYAQYEEWFRENVRGRVKLNNKEFDLLREVLHN